MVQHAASGMARHGEGDDRVGDRCRFGSLDDPPGVRCGVPVVGVNPDLSPEVLGVALGVGDVVAMAQQDLGQPAEGLDRFDDLPRPPGGVDHEVPARPPGEVRVGAERRTGVVAEPVDAVAEILGEDRRFGSSQRLVPDRASGADQDGPPGHLDLVRRLGLPDEERDPVGGVANDQAGGHLPGGVAVDAPGVDEPLARCPLGVAILEPGHTRRYTTHRPGCGRVARPGQ